MSPTRLSAKRTHIVLVPGFGGFDMLGQISYYAGVTREFLEWNASQSTPAQSVLHYFDNLPTAAVVTRAARLRVYLARLILRNEFQPDDAVVLVGHSTGGLDIRRLLWDLAESPEKHVLLDGIQEHERGAVRHERILKLIQRVVFLSVPQYGTNIAGWVGSHSFLWGLTVKAIHAAVATRSARPIDAFLNTLKRWIPFDPVGDSDLLEAVSDALVESDESLYRGEVELATGAREDYAELRLWSENIAADSQALVDLKFLSGSDEGGSPAQFTAGMRDKERARWDARRIKTRSYATVAECPFEPDVLRKKRVWSFTDPRSWPMVGLLADVGQHTDGFFRWAYRACANGSFEAQGEQHTATDFDTGTLRKLEDWENDGIVNTASMLWPEGARTLLVKGDHGDIIGHYRQQEVSEDDTPRRRRRYASYDLLRSNSCFGDEQFKAVWHDVFSFCLTGEGAARPPARE